MLKLNRNIKIRLFFLALTFPLSLSFAGVIVGKLMNSNLLLILFAFSGIILGLLLNIICSKRKLFTLALFYTPIPLAISMLTWWIADLFTSTTTALLIGLFGLFLGLWLNYILVMPYQFYKIKKRILAIVYLFFSISCLGFFMGIPVFNVLLGILAGNYISIRLMENYQRPKFVDKNIKQGSLFTSGIQLFIMVISGIIASTDIENSIQTVEKIIGITLNSENFYWLIASSTILLVAIQYWLTLITAKTMFIYWMTERKQFKLNT